MSWFFTRADNDGLGIASTPVTAAPFTVMGWMYCTDAANTQRFFTIYQAGGTGRWYFSIAGAVAGDPIRWYALEAGGATNYAETTTGYTINTWQHLAAIEYAANSRAVFLNGANKGTNVTALSPLNADSIYLGRAVVANTLNGYMGEIAVWNTALTDAQVALHAGGMLANRIQPANLVAWWMLKANSNDWFNVYNLVDVSGSPVWDVSHPRLKWWRTTGVERGVLRGAGRIR